MQINKASSNALQEACKVRRIIYQGCFGITSPAIWRSQIFDIHSKESENESRMIGNLLT